ncbi:MAG: DUF1667 domain-containing protein [Candidatus Korarchaeota archaeon]|nr:DUF1667 domain-containing protein [Candidatus Korarchaeota archaeon]
MTGRGEVRRLTCIVCPLGCEIEVRLDRGPGGDVRVLEVRGATCPRGREWAAQEVTDPRRVVITVVPVRGGDPPTVSVKTDRPIPKSRIPEFMRALAGLEVEAPVRVGQVLAKDVLDLANVVATRESRSMGRSFGERP